MITIFFRKGGLGLGYGEMTLNLRLIFFKIIFIGVYISLVGTFGVRRIECKICRIKTLWKVHTHAYYVLGVSVIYYPLILCEKKNLKNMLWYSIAWFEFKNMIISVNN